jgi:LPXTG-motif cell wall-anchored protein
VTAGPFFAPVTARFTGPDLMPQAGTGAGLVATGGLLLLAGRRRKQRNSRPGG